MDNNEVRRGRRFQLHPSHDDDGVGSVGAGDGGGVIASLLINVRACGNMRHVEKDTCALDERIVPVFTSILQPSV